MKKNIVIAVLAFVLLGGLAYSGLGDSGMFQGSLIKLPTLETTSKVELEDTTILNTSVKEMVVPEEETTEDDFMVIPEGGMYYPTPITGRVFGAEQACSGTFGEYINNSLIVYEQEQDANLNDSESRECDYKVVLQGDQNIVCDDVTYYPHFRDDGSLNTGLVFRCINDEDGYLSIAYADNRNILDLECFYDRGLCEEARILRNPK